MLGWVLRPLARGWLQAVQEELSLLPVPAGAPRQHVPGPDEDRVLVFGNGPATGFGVWTQELGLPGQLARDIARTTGRGVEVDLARGRGFTVASAVERLARVRVERYDAVVVTVGATDAGGLLPESDWEVGVRALLAAIRARTSSRTPVVLLGIRPQATAQQGLGVLNRFADRHAGRLDTVSARIASESPQVMHVPLEPALRGAGETRYFTPDSYRAIAEAIAGVLAPSLDRGHVDGSWDASRQRRRMDVSEEQRQDAVDRMQVASPEATERLQRLVRSASTLFGTTGAALTIIDGARQVHKASVGLDVDQIPRRLAICDRTIHRDGPLVVGDATEDPRTVGTDMRAAGEQVRFYAGYPIESPDGYRLGALCVFDTAVRDPADVDEEQLRELALRVQNQLWAEYGPITTP